MPDLSSSNWSFKDHPPGAINWPLKKRTDYDDVWIVHANIANGFALRKHHDGTWFLTFKTSHLFDNYWDAYRYWVKMNHGDKDG